MQVEVCRTRSSSWAPRGARRGLCQKSEGTDLLLILQPPAESAHMLTPHLIKQSKEQKPFCSSYFSPESITALLMARHRGRRRHFLPQPLFFFSSQVSLTQPGRFFSTHIRPRGSNPVRPHLSTQPSKSGAVVQTSLYKPFCQSLYTSPCARFQAAVSLIHRNAPESDTAF